MSIKLKILLSLLFCLLYIPGYIFLFKEIGNPEYSLPGVIIGAFFTIFGLFGHSLLIFEKQWHKIEGNGGYTKNIGYFFKIFGTILLLPLSLAFIYFGLFSQPDNYSEDDLKRISGTLARKPKFSRGAKSSTSLNLYLREYPFTFEPSYNEYLHYQTNLERDLEPGDTVELGILVDDYEKSISGTIERTYFERHVNQHIIPVYFIRWGGNVYYTAPLHNLLDKDDNRFSFIGVIIGFVFLIGCVSIWSVELTAILRRAGHDRLADMLVTLRQKRIL